MHKKDIPIASCISFPMVLAANVCTTNVTGFDVCEKAKEIASQVKPHLPMTLSGERQHVRY